MASGGAQSLVHGVRPNWGRIAAESFGNNVGHQVVGSAVERDREQQQQRQPQAIRREVAGQNDAVGYRDDGGLQARAETAWRQQERRRQTAIAEVQSLERAADVSLNGEAMLDEIVVTASRLPPGDEPGAMQRARDAYSEALKDALIGTGQILSDQMYFMASRASGGLIDDRGAAARNVELVRGTMDAIAGIPRQFAVGMYYLAHPGELNAEQIGRAMGGAAAGYVGGRVAAGLRGKGAVGYAGGAEGKRSSSTAITLARIEDRFASASREVGFIVDRESGKILGVKRANLASGAEIRLSSVIDYPVMKGNVFTHNHPLGGNISPGDVSTALGAGVAEFRAVTSTRILAISFNSPPAGVLGDPVKSVLFVDAEKAAIGAAYRAGVSDGSLVPPADLMGKKIWMSDYFIERLADRNPWIYYAVIQR